jgi:hypothetical protein
MEDTQMPEPLRQAVHQLVSEVVMNCQEVLRYTEPDLARDWKRMTLIRATDASDTMDSAAMLIAAYCQRTGMGLDTLASYLQTRQQRSRATGPRDADRHEVAGMPGTPRPADDDQDAQVWFSVGQGCAGDGLMHVLSDAKGLPLLVGVSAGNTHDSEGLKPMVEGHQTRHDPHCGTSNPSACMRTKATIALTCAGGSAGSASVCGSPAKASSPVSD